MTRPSPLTATHQIVGRRGQDLPVCIPTKTDQFPKLAASTIPVTKQQANSAQSPPSFSIGPKIFLRERIPALLETAVGNFSALTLLGLAVCSWPLLSAACGKGGEKGAFGMLPGFVSALASDRLVSCTVSFIAGLYQGDDKGYKVTFVRLCSFSVAPLTAKKKPVCSGMR